MTSESGKQELFAGLPRRRRLGGLVTGALALLICGAFLTDAVPTRSSEDWLYDLEARRDQLSRAYHARELAAQAGTERRAARAAPGAKARPTALASVVTPAVDHQPAATSSGHGRCVAATK